MVSLGGLHGSAQFSSDRLSNVSRKRESGLGDELSYLWGTSQGSSRVEYDVGLLF